MKREPISFFCYAKHADVAALTARGWVFCSDLGLPHSHYSVLMKWAGKGEPS